MCGDLDDLGGASGSRWVRASSSAFMREQQQDPRVWSAPSERQGADSSSRISTVDRSVPAEDVGQDFGLTSLVAGDLFSGA